MVDQNFSNQAMFPVNRGFWELYAQPTGTW